MPICNIGSSDGTPGQWSVSDYEHEIVDANGAVVDLKADYGLDRLEFFGDIFEITMSRSSDLSVVKLRWTGLTSVNLTTTDAFTPAEDGRSGLLGIRLMAAPPGPLPFEVELDWIRIVLTVTAFEIGMDMPDDGMG